MLAVRQATARQAAAGRAVVAAAVAAAVATPAVRLLLLVTAVQVGGERAAWAAR